MAHILKVCYNKSKKYRWSRGLEGYLFFNLIVKVKVKPPFLLPTVFRWLFSFLSDIQVCYNKSKKYRWSRGLEGYLFFNLIVKVKVKPPFLLPTVFRWLFSFLSDIRLITTPTIIGIMSNFIISSKSILKTSFQLL